MADGDTPSKSVGVHISHNTLTGVFLLEKIMKIKLIDVQTEVEEDVEFGTCELCTWTGSAEYPTFIFEKEDSTRFEVLGWEWDWGDLDTLYIRNVVLFNDYISQIEFDEDTEFDYRWLWNLSISYGENHG